MKTIQLDDAKGAATRLGTVLMSAVPGMHAFGCTAESVDPSQLGLGPARVVLTLTAEQAEKLAADLEGRHP